MKSLYYFNTLRFILLSFNIIALGSHFTQCMLYNEYQRRAELPGWFNAGHWQYLILYTSIILSFLCSLAICTHAICCKRGHILRGDKCLGLVNSVVLFITVLLITCVTNQEPWTNSRVEVVNPDRGYITYCRLLNRGTDATYPLLYQRCLLWNSTYIFVVLLCIFWILLLFSTLISNYSRIYVTRNDRRHSVDIPETTSNNPNTYDYDIEHKIQGEESSSKYHVPIAPQTEKVQLPDSYDEPHTISHLQLHQDPPSLYQYNQHHHHTYHKQHHSKPSFYYSPSIPVDSRWITYTPHTPQYSWHTRQY